ncbi:hypothetical protein O6H91_09G021100 [Diphasiastrum complanatum]|uniref:Uncharacterized protein n=1 Tax=Diphasiastrum complanatum TaxID=34168 RepID=A0ACC2CM77_DIPCM|nr:hypothetical protein O6H91_09G021100 [Diphasiastrum complanatum]
MNWASGSHKRKEPDELVADLLSNVSISPAKKFRPDKGLYPIIEEPHFVTPTDDFPVDLSEDFSSSALGVSSPSVSLFPSASGVADEKAIVLYKPVNPPLFPGGPPAGSSELPIRVNSLLPQKGIRVSAHSPFSFRAADKWYEDFYKSMPTISSSQEDLTMASDKEPDNFLAVIPWVPPSPVFSALGSNETVERPNLVTDSLVATDCEPLQYEDGGDEMAIDEGEEMAVEEGNSIDTNANFAPFVNAIPDLNTSWQHYAVLQPPNTSATWSG